MDLTAQAAGANAPVLELRPGARAWFALGVLVVLAFVSYLDRQIIALMVVPIEHDLHIRDTEVGLLQGLAFVIGYPIFAIPIGYAADRYSRRWVIFLAAAFWAICAMASGLAASFGELFLARVGVGLGEAAVAPAVGSLLSDIFPKRRLATIFSIYGSGVILGSGAALWLGEAVLEWAKGGVDWPLLGHLEAWQVAFIVTGAPALVLGFLVFLVPDPGRSGGIDAAAAAPWSEVFAFVRRSWLFLICFVVGQTFLMFCSTAGLAWMPAIMQRSFGWHAAELGSLLAIWVAVFGFSGQMTNGLIVDRMFRKHPDAHLRYYVVGALIIAASAALAVLAPMALLYLAFLFPLKMLLNFSGVLGAAIQVATPSRMRGRVSAVTFLIINTIGAMGGPSIVAFFTDHLFHDRNKVIWSLSLTVGIATPLAALLFWIGLKPMREAVQRDRAAEPVRA